MLQPQYLFSDLCLTWTLKVSSLFVKSLSQAEIKQSSERNHDREEEADFGDEWELFDPQVAQQNFGVVKVAINFWALQLVSIMSEDCQHQTHDATPNERQLHCCIHERWNIRGEVEAVDCETKKWSH